VRSIARSPKGAALEDERTPHPSYVSGLRPAVRPIQVPQPKPARSAYAGAAVDTLELDDIDTAVEKVSAILVAQSLEQDDEPKTFVDPVAIEDAIREAQANGLPSPAPDAPKLAPPRPTLPFPTPEMPFVDHASVTPLPGIVHHDVPPRPLPQQRVHLPPPVVRRAFIAALQPLPPAPEPIRPLAIFGGVMLGALAIGAVALAVLTFGH
jgi:hypothetical protein